MKKKTVLATILCTLFAVAGCGNAATANSGNNGNSGADTQNESDAPAPEIDIPDEDESQGSEENLNDLVGTWYEADVLDSRTLIIDQSGNFTLEYRGGGALYGTIEVTTEVMPDDTETYWYTFFDQEGEVWEALAIPDEGIQDDLYFGQGGEPHFVKADSDGESSEAVDAAVQEFLGLWQCDRCSITIDDGFSGIVAAISWANSADETVEWYYSCVYDESTGTLVCNGDAIKQVVAEEDGESVGDVEYFNGSGSFAINDGILTWTDEEEDTGAGMEFEKVRV